MLEFAFPKKNEKKEIFHHLFGNWGSEVKKWG